MIPSSFDLPIWSNEWRLFATWRDLPFAAAGLVLILLLILWWRQQTKTWTRVVLTALLMALLLAIASYYIFQVPPHFAGCPAGCEGCGVDGRQAPGRGAIAQLAGAVDPPAFHSAGIHEGATVIAGGGNHRNAAGQPGDIARRLPRHELPAIAQLAPVIVAPALDAAGARHDAGMLAADIQLNDIGQLDGYGGCRQGNARAKGGE